MEESIIKVLNPIYQLNFMSSVKIIATIGPGSNKPETLQKLKDRGVNFFRINLSHTDEDEIEDRIKDINKYGIPMILDTEGPQIRSGNREEIDIVEGSDIKIWRKEIAIDSKNICLNPLESIDTLREGDLIFIDFNSVLLKVSETSHLKSDGYILCKSLIGGKMGGRKAVYVDSPTFNMPPFSKKDKKAVELAKKHGINHFTLSFMSSAEDVREFKKYFPGAKVFSKIESRKGLDNFVEIAKESDGLLIDRGDLSHQVPLERIPFVQKSIIAKCREMNKEIFVATNTLEQMSYSLKPNRAEVNDIINTILDGATAIALTKETAVGKYPVETVNMLSTLIKQTEFIGKTEINKEIIQKINLKNYAHSDKMPKLLTDPHGGVLVNRFDPFYEINKVKKGIVVSEEILMDVEQIATGGFSPIEGFLTRKDFDSVVNNMKLANGVIWTLPIILQVREEQTKGLSEGDVLALELERDGQKYAVLHLEEIYKIDKKDYVKKVYGTEDLAHPGVKNIMNGGDFILGGKITMVKRRKSPYGVYELTPAQTRRIFSERGWSKVIAFHTRNVIHRSHEFIQLEGLSKSMCDGLFVHPVIGKKKSGDFEADVIVESYEKMIEEFYPKNKVVLCSWASYSRYGGPREAVFTALVRKNYGASHFIVGRDHTGVGTFYPPTASHEIFNKFNSEELGIIPVKFNKVFYSKIKDEHVHEDEDEEHKEEDKLHISGTEARKMLQSGSRPPNWFMREEISDIIINKIKRGEKVFVD